MRRITLSIRHSSATFLLEWAMVFKPMLLSHSRQSSHCSGCKDSFKIAVVDPQAVIEKSKSGSRALATLKEHAQARENVLKSDQKELGRLQEELKSAGSTLSESELKQKQEAFARKYQEFQKRGQEYQAELGPETKELGAGIYEENRGGHKYRGQATWVFFSCR